MPGVSFDRAADYYDETRGHPEGVADLIRAALIRKLVPTASSNGAANARFLELGVGTGRIALPFMLAGDDYIGVDLSGAMLRRLSQKLGEVRGTDGPSRRSVQADVMHPPFANETFDVVILVHVLHLVADWRQVLREAQRVLRMPHGKLVIASDGLGPSRDGEGTTAEPPARKTRRTWDNIVRQVEEEYGVRRPERRVRVHDTIRAFLQEQGATAELVTLVEYEGHARSARDMASELTARLHSADWATTDAVHEESTRRLERWLREDCPEPERRVQSAERFGALIASWQE